jgi:putative ABC transport system ATP-binding protein
VSSPIVAFRDVRFAWPRGTFGISVPEFTVAAGERLLLVGPSGSGKSTLLSLLSGIVLARSGTLQVLGHDVHTLSGSARDRFRGEHFGIVFQMFNLLPYASVLDNVLLPLRFAPVRRRRVRLSGSEADEGRRLLRALGLDPQLETATAGRLSVGQQQRVAVARALVGEPEIILADEPTSALDQDRQLAFLDLLFTQAARTATTVILVSHDRTLAPRFDRVVELATIAKPWAEAA